MTRHDPLRIEADYLVETAFDPRFAVEAMAGEQSSGTFVPVPGETPELKERAAARIETLELIDETVVEPSLPHAATPKSGAKPVIRRATTTLSWPLDNIGPSLPNLLATVAGNLFDLQQFSGLRITDIRLPTAFAQRYPGPRFGIDGTRRLAGVAEGPLIGTIIKPSIGLGPEETAALARTLCEAGIDFIKDDELQSNGSHCPFETRARAVMRVVNDHADRTGKKVMIAFNITGDMDELRRRHDLVVELGGTCVMASLNSIGLAAMIELGRFAQVPIHGHRNGWGYLSRHPLLGWSFVAWHKIWRLAGADHMHVNGLQSKFADSDENVITSAKACFEPLFASRPCLSMPVFSSAQSARQAHGTFAAIGSTDLIVAAGGGIMAHPDGPAAGVAGLRQAWEAATTGVALQDHACDHHALRRALEMRSA